jgi:hypothetical protein
MKQMYRLTLRLTVVLMAAVFSVAYASAPDGAALEYADAGDSWKQITQAPDLAGRWEGSVDVAIPYNPETGFPQSSLTISMVLDYEPVASGVKLTIKADLDRFLTDWANVDGLKGLGITKDILWMQIERQFQEDITTGRYFVIVDISDSVENLLAADSGMTIQMNQAKTRIHFLLDEAFSFGIGDEGFREIFLDKAGNSSL